MRIATEADAPGFTRLLDLLFEDPQVGRCMVAPDGTALRANREWLRATGLVLDGILGASLVDLFPDARDVVLALHAHARAGRHVELPRHVRRIAGRETWWEGSIDPVRMDGGTGLLITTREVDRDVARQEAGELLGQVGMGVDVTDHHRGEATLHESEQKRLGSLANASIGFALATRDGRFLEANPAYERFYGVLSSMYSAVLLATDDGHIEFVNGALCKLLHLEESPEELVGQSGFEMLAGAKTAYLHPDEEVARIEEIIRRGQPVKGEEIALRGGRTCLRDFVPLEVDGRPCGRLWLHFDITDRKRAEEALRDQDRRKGEFLSVLSHELRNPLAPIRNSIYLLERSAPGKEQATRAREIIRRQTEHLARLVDDLLDTTRISRGKIALQRTRVDLRDIVRKTTDDLRSVFSHAGVELHVETDAGPAWISADVTRITQVLGNLLQNAVKFTPAGGSVTVMVAAKGDRVELCVRDDGIGMEPGTVEHMFEPFAQAETTPASTKGGLGPVLPLVKGLVELHGGTVEARSGGIGRGSEFLVRLPTSEAGTEAGRALAAAAEVRPREILVIEDNLDAGETLAAILEFHGHHVRVARDGRTGLELAREPRPDVVLCDIGLPDMDGYAVARELRRRDALRSTRLVALSGYAQPEDRQRAHDAGFDAHVAKPTDVDVLLSVLANDS
jgi:PAS domain S-box-containing protein